MTTTDHRMWALLIGVDCYMRNLLPDDSWYPSLGGCVRDIVHVEEFLRTKLGLGDDRILKLAASYTGPQPPSQDHDYQPPEPREQWPTYENMVAAFKHVTELAQPGDQVYIHYSGHGGRAATAYPQIGRCQRVGRSVGAQRHRQHRGALPARCRVGLPAEGDGGQGADCHGRVRQLPLRRRDARTRRRGRAWDRDYRYGEWFLTPDSSRRGERGAVRRLARHCPGWHA